MSALWGRGCPQKSPRKRLAAGAVSSDSSTKSCVTEEEDMSDDGTRDIIARRSFLKGAGAAGTAVATALAGTPPAAAQAQTAAPAKTVSSPPAAEGLLTLTATEAAFLSAAYDTFIPADRLSPSGTDCGL